MKSVRTGGFLLLLLFALIFPWSFSNPAITEVAVFSLLYAASAIGWNIFSGYTGYISLGHATFFGVGAYTMALLCQDWTIPAGLTPFLLLPLSGLVACTCAALAGWVALRVRGNPFVIITIAIFFSFQLLAYNLGDLTGGSIGMNLPIPPWSGTLFNVPFYYAALLLSLAALGLSWWVRSSKFGLGLLAIRDDEDRARGLGIPATDKWIAYILSALFAGIAGGIYAYFVGSIYPATVFDPTFDVAITLMTFLGGLGTLGGPVVGALLIEPMQQYLTLQFGAAGFDQILYGGIFLATLLVLPKGIIPSLRWRWMKWHNAHLYAPVEQVLPPEEFPVKTGGERNG